MTGPEEVRGGDRPAVVTPPQVTVAMRRREARGRPLAARPRPRIDPNRLRVDPRRSRANRCGASFGMESVPHELLFEPLGQCPRSASPSSRLGCLVGSRAQPDDKGRAVEFPAPLESTEPRRPVHDGTSEGEPVPPLSSSGARARRRRSDHLGRQPTAGGARPAGRLTSGSTPDLLSTRPRQGRGPRAAGGGRRGRLVGFDQDCGGQLLRPLLPFGTRLSGRRAITEPTTGRPELSSARSMGPPFRQPWDRPATSEATWCPRAPVRPAGPLAAIGARIGEAPWPSWRCACWRCRRCSGLGAGEGPANVGRLQPWIGRTARRARRSIRAVDGAGPKRAGSSRASRRLVMARVVEAAPMQDGDCPAWRAPRGQREQIAGWIGD